MLRRTLVAIATMGVAALAGAAPDHAQTPGDQGSVGQSAVKPQASANSSAQATTGQSSVTAAPCPPSSLQTAIDVYLGTAKPDAKTDELQQRLDKLAQDCPKDPYVLKVTATAYATLKNTDAKVAVGRLSRARDLFRQMHDNMQPTNPPKPVQNEAKQTVYFGFDDLYTLETQVRTLLWNAEEQANLLADEDKPLAKGARPPPCTYTLNSDVQQAFFLLKDKDNAGAFNFMDTAIAACTANIDKGQYKEMLARRAKSLFASAQRDLTKPDAYGKLKRAKVDADRFVQLRKVYDAIYWSESDHAELTRLLASQMMARGDAPPEKAWFKPPAVTDPMTLQFIGASLDTAWAEDAKLEASAGYRVYRERITALFVLAKASPDEKAARKLLYKAAGEHAAGRIRAPENKSLKEPPNFLYKWIDPDYTPPAQPASAAPAPSQP